MLSFFTKVIADNQPVATTGLATHIMDWVTSSPYTRSYSNPAFNGDNDSDEVAIYFIHGTADRTSALKKITERLIDETGLPSEISSLHLVAFNNRFSGTTIEDFSEQLQKEIQAHGHKKVILISHSRGGLVAAHFTQFLAHNASINVLMNISICSPFGGSQWARLPFTLARSVEEMRPDSDFLNNLDQSIIKNPIGQYRFVVATQDWLVTQEEGTVPEYIKTHPNSLLQLDRHSHSSITSSHRLVKHIHSWIMALLNKLREAKTAQSNHSETVLSPYKIIDDYRPNPRPQI